MQGHVRIMESKLGYFLGLTAASKTRYETNFKGGSLYQIQKFAVVNLSDMVMYVISATSLYSYTCRNQGGFSSGCFAGLNG